MPKPKKPTKDARLNFLSGLEPGLVLVSGDDEDELAAFLEFIGDPEMSATLTALGFQFLCVPRGVQIDSIPREIMKALGYKRVSKQVIQRH